MKPSEGKQFRFLRPEDIGKLSSYEFAPKNLVEGYLSGRHRSKHKGPSVEFHDYRPYVKGDDLALVDWSVYARTDRHFIKTFEQETNMECHIFLDSSASMGYGEEPSKLEYASFFAAALIYLVIKNRDRVSLMTFDEQLREFCEPGSTMKHLKQLMSILEENKPGKKTSVSQALERAFPLLKRRATVVVISDFMDDPVEIFQALNPYIHRGFRIHLFQVLTPEEITLTMNGMFTFTDMETGAQVVAGADQVRKRYQDAMQQHMDVLRELSARRKADYSLARTDMPFFELFDQFTK